MQSTWRCQRPDFSAETFEEIAGLSQHNGKAMFDARDSDHLTAIQAMRALMEDPQARAKWFESKRQEFNALPDE